MKNIQANTLLARINLEMEVVEAAGYSVRNTVTVAEYKGVESPTYYLTGSIYVSRTVPSGDVTHLAILRFRNNGDCTLERLLVHKGACNRGAGVPKRLLPRKDIAGLGQWLVEKVTQAENWAKERSERIALEREERRASEAKTLEDARAFFGPAGLVVDSDPSGRVASVIGGKFVEIWEGHDYWQVRRVGVLENIKVAIPFQSTIDTRLAFIGAFAILVKLSDVANRVQSQS